MSRLWGGINDINVPRLMREPFYKLYIWAFDVNLAEAAVRDLKHYRNLGEFFRRRLTGGVRPVDKEHFVVSVIPFISHLCDSKAGNKKHLQSIS